MEPHYSGYVTALHLSGTPTLYLKACYKGLFMALQKPSAVRKNGVRWACVLPLVHHDMSTQSPLRANLITIAGFVSTPQVSSARIAEWGTNTS